MMVQGRTAAARAARLLAGLAACFLAVQVGLAQPPRPPESFLEDAELTDVFFLDPDRGWAVGDRGVIWFTEDGGRHWRRQESPVSCRLESVCFVDDRTGWIVGGWTHPYTHRNSGVVLRTGDGGQRWELLPRLSLPALQRVRFFDRRSGWAVGAASAMYPAGVFRTEDGGLSWSSVAPASNTGWLSGDFLDARRGVVVGREVTAAAVQQSSVVTAAAPDIGLRAARCVRLAAARLPSAAVSGGSAAGWLVGDGGLVLRTGDGGRSWSLPAERLPGGMTEYFDFCGVACLGDRCWIVGSPGSRVLYTEDGGRSWQLGDTGQSLPLLAVTFLDEYRGWAVGALGTILATRDGGRSWTLQRRGGERVAWLWLLGRPEQLPLELAVDLSANDGLLGAVEIVGSVPHTVAGSQRSHPENRLREAVSVVGGSHANLAWGFPLPVGGRSVPLASIVAGWESRHGGPPAQRLQEYLVRKIRQWRPEVVVTEPLSPHGRDDLAQLINQVVLAAIEAAADPVAEADQALVTGLAPWQAKKVFSFEGRDQQATLNVTTAELAPQLGRSLADQAVLGWQLIEPAHQWPAQTLGFRLLLNRLPADLGRQNFFSGIVLPPGNSARRQLGAPPPKDLRTISRLIQQRRNIEHLLRYASESSHRGAAWLGQVEDLIRGLDPPSGGRVLFELGQSLERSGQLELAADVYAFLLKRFPDDPLNESAAIWLVHYTASGEARWAFQRPGKAISGLPSAPADPPAESLTGVVPAGYFAASDGSSLADPATARAAAIGGALTGTGGRTRQPGHYAFWIRDRFPPMYVDPAVRFPLLAAERIEGSRGETESYLNSLLASRAPDAWWACAKAELWLAAPTRFPPKPIATCIRAVAPPKLDGRLADPVWQDALPLSLVSTGGDDAQWPAAVMLARDDEFLYLAASCRQAPAATYPSDSGPRPRDPDLADRDRVEILLDADRDYATYYRLVVDHRGWVREECLGNPSWNPQWYVAAAVDQQSWSVECAIPWSELVERPPDAQQHWAVGLQRIVPGAGFQAWTQPAAPEVRPEGFGLLRFP